MSDLIVYDVEIALDVKDVPGRWDNPEGMGFGSAVAYDCDADRYHFFLHEKGRIALMHFLNGKIAITFNGIKFDSRVVLGNDRLVRDRWTEKDKIGWFNYDILLEYVKARFQCSDIRDAELKLGQKGIHDGTFNLDGLCQGSLGRGKIGHGADAPKLYRDMRYDDLLQYNLEDVRLTRKLFDFLRFNGYVIDRSNRRIEIPSSSRVR